MTLENNRLYIRALTASELLLYIADNGDLEKRLKIKYRPRSVPDRVKKSILEKIIPFLKDNDSNNLFYTFWTVVDKERELMVADICFKGPPGENGTVEIGYGTYPDFQAQGIMTEAIAELLKWALSQDAVEKIVAHTKSDNYTSIKVLQKNNFESISQNDGSIYWELQKPGTVKNGAARDGKD